MEAALEGKDSFLCRGEACYHYLQKCCLPISGACDGAWNRTCLCLVTQCGKLLGSSSCWKLLISFCAGWQPLFNTAEVRGLWGAAANNKPLIIGNFPTMDKIFYCPVLWFIRCQPCHVWAHRDSSSTTGEQSCPSVIHGFASVWVSRKLSLKYPLPSQMGCPFWTEGFCLGTLPGRTVSFGKQVKGCMCICCMKWRVRG